MSDYCESLRPEIAALVAGELSAEKRAALGAHLTECETCRNEQRELESLLQVLRSGGDEPVPRDFFVYEPRAGSASRAWSHFSTPWRAGLAVAASALLILGLMAVTGLKFQARADGWVIAFGELPPSRVQLEETFRTEVTGLVEERMQERERVWLEAVRQEIGRASEAQKAGQEREFQRAMTEVTRRFDERLESASLELKNDLRTGNLELFRAISQRRDQDMKFLVDRLNLVAALGEQRIEQTETLVAGLLTTEIRSQE